MLLLADSPSFCYKKKGSVSRSTALDNRYGVRVVVLKVRGDVPKKRIKGEGAVQSLFPSINFNGNKQPGIIFGSLF